MPRHARDNYKRQSANKRFYRWGCRFRFGFRFRWTATRGRVFATSAGSRWTSEGTYAGRQAASVCTLHTMSFDDLNDTPPQILFGSAGPRQAGLCRAWRCAVVLISHQSVCVRALPVRALHYLILRMCVYITSFCLRISRHHVRTCTRQGSKLVWSRVVLLGVAKRSRRQTIHPVSEPSLHSSHPTTT